MELSDFLRETQAAVRSQMNEGALYEELVFSGIVMEHMADIGMTAEPVECHYEGKVGNANLRLSGYSCTGASGMATKGASSRKSPAPEPISGLPRSRPTYCGTAWP